MQIISGKPIEYSDAKEFLEQEGGQEKKPNPSFKGPFSDKPFYKQDWRSRDFGRWNVGFKHHKEYGHRQQ